MIKIEGKVNNDNYKILYSKTIKNYNKKNEINEMNISNDESTSPKSPKSHNCFRIRFDARGNLITKGKNKKHHILFCDQLNIPKKLIHVETIESYKSYNARNNFEDNLIREEEKNNKCLQGRVSCCCLIY